MFNKRSKFTIKLPLHTNKDVSDWFQTMNSKNVLADALVELVYESLKTGTCLEPLQIIINDNVSSKSTEKAEVNQGDLFENLYNWQDSNSAIFLEDRKIVSKEKKKMLYV
jgi:hypothetical protein